MITTARRRGRAPLGTSTVTTRPAVAASSLQPPPPGWRATVGGSKRETDLLWYGLSASTRRSYESQVKSFVDFCRIRLYPPPFFPARPAHVSEWVADEAHKRVLSGTGLFHDTLRAKVTALGSWHKDLGHDVDLFTGRVRRVIHGAHRRWGTVRKKQPLPITLPVLSAVDRALRNRPSAFGGRQSALCLRAAFQLAFGCFLRLGEITYSSFDPALHLDRDCVLWEDGLPSRLCIKTSKTDPRRRGVEVPIPRGRDRLCPATVLARWMRVAPAQQPSSPLFVLPGGSFDKRRVVDLLRTALFEAGVTPHAFSGHSFRRGAATWAASIGVPAARIQILGRWNSTAFRRYLEVPLRSRALAVSELFAAPVSQSVLPPDGIPRDGACLFDPVNPDSDD